MKTTTERSSKTQGSTPTSKLLKLEKELNQRFMERQTAIRVMLLAVLTKQHCLIFGKHGAAKSNLVQALSEGIGGDLFRVQLGKDSTTDQIFGPVKISALQKDEQRRAYQNFLPGKRVAFLDEVDKSNTVILNALYTAMEERLFPENGNMERMPLITLFGAANKVEQLQTEALAPLLDRFLFRIEVDWIQQDNNFLEFLRRTAEGDHPSIKTTLDLTELQSLQLEVQQIAFPTSTLEALAKLKRELEQENIFASTRRWGYVIGALKANALMAGDTHVWEEHFDVLQYILCSTAQHTSTVQKVLKNYEDSNAKKFQKTIKDITKKTKDFVGTATPSQILGQSSLLINDFTQLKDGVEQMLPALQGKRLQQAQQLIHEFDKCLKQIEDHRQKSCGI